jgi:hypothetical protein
MEPVQRRDFLKNMGGIAATAAVIGTTMAPAARAAGLSSSTDGHHNEGCWDNDHSCQHQSTCHDEVCDEQFDFFCFFEIRCDTDRQNNCNFDVFCQGNGQSWRKKCDDGHKRKHHWRLRRCEQKKQCGQKQSCDIPCTLICHCVDDDGCGYTDHNCNFNVHCDVDDNGCCCYSIKHLGFS